MTTFSKKKNTYSLDLQWHPTVYQFGIEVFEVQNIKQGNTTDDNI